MLKDVVSLSIQGANFEYILNGIYHILMPCAVFVINRSAHFRKMQSLCASHNSHKHIGGLVCLTEMAI